MEIIEILGKHISFLDNVFKNLENDKINVSEFELDYICYRVESLEKYIYLKKELKNIAILLTETIIGGRKISTFKLNKPIIYANREIYLLELPSPKIGNHYSEGYEHVEFVIDESFDKFIERYSNITFDIKSINKKVNPDIKLKYEGCSIKFHHNTLEYVIEVEQK